MCACVFELNNPPTAKVIWRWRRGHVLISSHRLEDLEIELETPGYKASGLSTTPRRLIIIYVSI